MLLANNIIFNRDNKKILNKVSFTLSANKIIHVTGNNGAGKTTLLKIITNILEPNEGEIFWNGKNINKNPFIFYKNLTYIMDKSSSNANLTIFENIMFWIKLYSSSRNLEQVESVLKLLSLYRYKNTLVSSLSYGEVKKLELVRLIIEQKKIWVLDEPYIGLDLISTKLINETIVNHARLGGMVIFTSHVPVDIAKLEILHLKNYENY